jgi:hypothetical protein
MKVRLLIVVLAAILLTNIFLIEEAEAIPAFARRYKISCNTCHAPIPKLKPYGDEFAGAGFILQEEEKARDYVSAGDDLLWLNKDFPLAARFDAFALYDQDKTVENDLQTPYGLKLLSGGTLYKNIGYYFYFYMAERGEVAGIEDAYVHFDNVFGSNLDIMVGQFQTSDPLMKRELRLTFEDYMIYKTRVGASGANLAYDRGVMMVYGIEQTGTDLAGFVVNGNGKPDAGDNKKFDHDTFKNFGLRINQGIGDIGSIGFYYYNGKEASTTWGDRFTNEITYMGPDVNIGFGPLEFTGQYLIREDSNPLMYTNAVNNIKTEGVIAELIYAPQLDRSRWYLTALYNHITSDLDDDPALLESYDASLLAYHTATLSGTYLLSRNLRLVAEYTRDLERDLNKMVVGFVSAY